MNILTLLAIIVAPLILKAEYWTAEKVNEVSWFAPMYSFVYQGDIYMAGTDRSIAAEGNRIDLYKYSETGFDSIGNVEYWMNNISIDKLEVLAGEDFVNLLTVGVGIGNTPKAYSIIGDSNQITFLNNGYRIENNVLYENGIVTETQSGMNLIFADEKFIYYSKNDDIYIIDRELKDTTQIAKREDYLDIDYNGDVVFIEGLFLKDGKVKKLDITLENPFYDIADFLYFEEEIYYWYLNKVYRYVEGDEDELVYTFSKANDLYYGNFNFNRKIFLTKDDKVYFYDAHRGLIQTEDFKEFKYLGKIQKDNSITLANINGRFAAMSNGHIETGDDPRAELEPLEISSIYSHLLKTGKDTSWLIQAHEARTFGHSKLYRIKNNEKELAIDSLLSNTHVFPYYDSSIVISFKGEGVTDYYVHDLETDKEHTLSINGTKLSVDALRKVEFRFFSHYADKIYYGKYRSSDTNKYELVPFDNVYDSQGNKQDSVGLWLYVQNPKFRALSTKDTIWYEYDSATDRFVSTDKVEPNPEQYLLDKPSYVFSPVPNNIIATHDSLSVDGGDTFYPVTYYPKPYSFLEYKGNYYFSSRNEIYQLYLVPTSVEEESRSPISYPNPTTGSLTLDQRFDWVEVYSADGRLIRAYREAETINISDLPKGAYYLKLDNGIIEKIILE